MLERLETLKGKFWTGFGELLDAVYALDEDLWVDDYTDEKMFVYSNNEEYEHMEWVLDLVVAGSTIAVKHIEEVF